MYGTALVFGATATFALYIPVHQHRATRLYTTALDRRVPFVPASAFLYAGFLLLFPAAAIMLAPMRQWYAFLLALIIAGLLYALVRPFVPWGTHHADPQGKGLSRALVRQIYTLDGEHPRRSFPSVHVYLSLICASYLSLAFPAYSLLFWALALAVSVSTLLIKQHNVVDVLGGVAWAAIAVTLASAFSA